ncbi:hypothetical protein NPA07_03255 [Mycoplasmopsis caviae]|uniref:Uncharacterized protein n=1 Tax=Mycoplasmopsis caviae TaxID=55603 RepID=A0A3P8MFC4_9BACT|nr:hypothetical protein [Mycoplasmopsis caviae]UUD34814.1 hypothetical protein NPA07_03255 [Mycoplasmopsis caviae]VDR42333.1 Uncharacterised protein [Mycoplasmopsis caviae]
MKIFKDEKLIKNILKYNKSNFDISTLESIANSIDDKGVKENYINKIESIFKSAKEADEISLHYHFLTLGEKEKITSAYSKVIEQLPTIKPENINPVETFTTNFISLLDHTKDEQALEKILNTIENVGEKIFEHNMIVPYDELCDSVEEDVMENGLFNSNYSRGLISDVVNKSIDTTYVEMNGNENGIEELFPRKFIGILNYTLSDFTLNELYEFEPYSENEEESLVSSVEFSETSSQRM